MKRSLVAFLFVSIFLFATPSSARSGHVISIKGTEFFVDGHPFAFTGVSFFNAIYNKAFNENSQTRRAVMQKFQRYGVNVLRVWAQWDNKNGYADTCAKCTLYEPDGKLIAANVALLKNLLADADAVGTVVEVTMFAQESWFSGVRLGPAESDRATSALIQELRPYRNVVVQIWNEFSERTVELVKVVRAADPKRIVTSSPGVSGVLGSDAHNRSLDFLSPHTSRQDRGQPWQIAPRELSLLLSVYGKPVVDDEPARNGTKSFGGPDDETFPNDHILQIQAVWNLGGYVIYHHDMMQTGYGTPAVPPNGIPDPEFSPYHKKVFEFLSHRERYRPNSNARP